MKKTIIIIIVLVALGAVILFLNSRQAKAPSLSFLSATPILDVFSVAGADTNRGMIKLSFIKDNTEVRYLNIMLGGHWIWQNLPVKPMAGLNLSLPFLISDSSVKELPMQVLLSRATIKGESWNDVTAGADSITGIFITQKIELASLEDFNSCADKIAEYEVDNQFAIVPAEGQDFAGTDISATSNYKIADGCFDLPSTGFLIPSDQLTDEQIFLALTQQLSATAGDKQVKKFVGLKLSNKNKSIVQVRGTGRAGKNLIVWVSDPMIDRSTDNAVIGYRLENQTLNGYPWGDGSDKISSIAVSIE